ncbi:cyclin-A2-2-like isoform X1 [Sesamum indicum]|uniref:Cyclin-A2-2-like isoform X1 n=1 Tax=Sesamum indicum TaxID=4182 RepID=A0A6I9TB27_SESIN|nr:cyclin-A2-2-like isoform X1 [Sesamum indicum]XP_020550236.1 cyclin-A2-2-like isoform X1 [Sesamum indicum]
MKHAVMNDENRTSNFTEPTVRITRARAKVLRPSNGLPPLYPSAKQDDRRVLRANSKRAASDNNKTAASSAACPQHKRRAVLKDVTNITCQSLYINCTNAAACQPSKQDRKGSLQKKGKAEPRCVAKNTKVSGYRSESIMDERNKVRVKETQEISSTTSSAIEPTEFINGKISGEAGLIPLMSDSSTHIPLISASDRADHAEDGKLCVKQENLDDRGITDIDSKHKDPQMCSLYAADIYSNLYSRQVDRRPFANYMEKLQRDITQGMRGILIDWLVEVSEEYRLVPDTLYLTVNLIDRFLSENYIEKQKLQLLGVTCMLIASKYEEICAPRVEEFCFITDNTYTKEEVVKMESRVLNFLGFQLSVPTTKKFLRRFIQAAQVSYKVPSVELEFLANYLAELTLIDYSFLKFLPSLIAASAVFLARWTLDQSEHPWNPTLEHYTRYKTSELKTAVRELQDLQLNTSGCMLNAVREKYRQPKFKCVSTLSSPKPVQSLF